ncbi:hypothetical protein JW711_02455 [Candidatus Woesearchaeota archaeon]|nr:hypothetical protein [Candidatus Woesearchaeota archaeon]
MAIYRLAFPHDKAQFFARDPDHIVELIAYYHRRIINDGLIGSPKAAGWTQGVPSADEIGLVDLGVIRYHTGPSIIRPHPMGLGLDLHSEKMRVTPDFEVHVSPEALFYFDDHRMLLRNAKRCRLYKMSLTGGPSDACLNFIPEDVLEGMLTYDLTPHLEIANKAREYLMGLTHPNIDFRYPSSQRKSDSVRGYTVH